ncbi:MAG: ROK family protein [Chloroflexi bacterium]|nr:ROK family protein [Chloroflexota bacterium]
MSSPTMVAVDLGGTRMRIAVFDAACQVLYRSAGPTPASEPEALPDAMRAAIAAVDVEVAGAVVGVPGVVDYATDRPLDFPNLPAWQGTVTASWLADRTGVSVLLANDADLAALGEHRFGAGRGVSDMVYLTISTGVGGGVIIGGQLLHGRRSLAEIGHTIIDGADGMTVENLASGTALKQATGIDGEEVISRVQNGDIEATRAFGQMADSVGIAVANAVQCFMPQRVVIGGGVSQAGELLLSRVREKVADLQAARQLSPSEIVIAQGGDDVGLLGAFALWQDCTASEVPDMRPSPREPGRQLERDER